MIDALPPGLILILGGLLIPLLRGRAQAIAAVILPVLGFAQLLMLEPGSFFHLQLFDYQLTVVRVDRLSLVFGYIFHIAAFMTAVYALNVRDGVQHCSAMVYVGSAVGAVFAGDLITLFIYWELTAVTSVFLIWASRTERAYRAGMRYLIIQVGSGVVLLAGVILHVSATGSLDFDRLIGADGLLRSASVGVVLIFAAFGIKCAFPLLHPWLQDTYPESTPTGTVFLSIFTTKLAIYALARGFAGTDCLIWIGATMTAFPIFYAVIENDLRRVLTYSLNNQLGFMVLGIGIGTKMALNGAVSYAFANIIFEGLLFMAMGAVLLRTGTCKGSELGGLYKSMPLTTAFCIVGAASISAFPFLSGFVTKSMILDETAAGGHTVAWLVLALRLGRRFPSLRHQDPVLRLLRARRRVPRQGGAAPHAVRDGGDGTGVCPHRPLPRAALLDPAVPRGLPPLHHHPRGDAVPAAAVLRPRLHRAQGHRHLPGRDAVGQPRCRLDLSQGLAGVDPVDRQTRRSDW